MLVILVALLPFFLRCAVWLAGKKSVIWRGKRHLILLSPLPVIKEELEQELKGILLLFVSS